MQMDDKSMEQRVWQRVGAAPAPPTQGDISAMYDRCRCREQTYRKWVRRAAGPVKWMLQSLVRLEQEEGLCLRGILQMRMIQADRRRFPADKGSLEQLLPRYYRESRQLWADYTALSFDREVGPVFAALAEQKQIQAAKIMALRGRLPNISEKIQK